MSAPRLPLLLVAFLLVAGLGLAWLGAERLAATSASTAADVPTESGAASQTAGSRATQDSQGAGLPDEAAADLHALASRSLACASDGDAVCAWQVFDALVRCQGLYRQSRAEKEHELASHGVPIDLRDRILARHAACAGFAAEGERERFGPLHHWLRIAYAGRHPRALAHAAIRARQLLEVHDDMRDQHTMTGEEERGGGYMDVPREMLPETLDDAALNAHARTLYLEALSARHPGLIFEGPPHAVSVRAEVGFPITDDSFRPYHVEAVAWALLGCELGHPCDDSDRLRFVACESWECIATLRNRPTEDSADAWREMLRFDIRPEEAATLETRLAFLRAAYGRGDYTAMLDWSPRS